MFRIGYDAIMRDAQTKEQYIAAGIALCLEQTGELPAMDELCTVYVNGLDEEFTAKFGSVTRGDIYACVANILNDYLKKN